MAILTLDDYKKYKGLTGTLDNEDQINAFLDVVDDEIKRYCNNKFLVDDVETIPKSLEIIAVSMVDIYLLETKNISSDGINNATYSQSFEGNSITIVNPYDVIQKQIKLNKEKLTKFYKMYPRLNFD